MKINWKVRLNNKNFWITAISALFLLVQAVVKCFGVTLDLGEIGNNILSVVNAAFVLLSILGIVNDPTTAGIGDSTQALTYSIPKKKEDDYDEN